MENYSVFVRLMLQNELSAGLLLASGQFTKLNAQAELFQARLKSIKTMGLIGGGLLFGGIVGLKIADASLKYAEDYTHQLNILNMAGLSQKQIAEAVGTAWKNTHDIMTVSARNSLAMWNDLRIVFGSTEEATRALPYVSRMQGILMSSKEGKEAANDKDFAFSVAKALDIIGAVNSKEEFAKEASLMTADVAAFQGRVTPKMFQSTFAYARQAKYAMDDVFKYQILPTLMMEYALGNGGAGGGSRGVGPMIAAMYRFTNQGFINKAALPELESLGLVGGSSQLHNKKYDEDINKGGKYLKTTTSGTTLLHGLKDFQLAGRNPFLWVNEVLVPAIEKKYGSNLTREQLQSHITQITRGNQLAGSLMTEFAVKQYAFIRDQKLVQQAMQKTPDELFTMALLNDPRLAHAAMSEQWENLMVSISQPMIAILIPALTEVASLFNSLSETLMKYPSLAKNLAYGFVGLSAAMAFSGTLLLLTAGFKALYAVISFGGLLAAPFFGIAAGIGLILFGFYKLSQVLGINWAGAFNTLVTGTKWLYKALVGYNWSGLFSSLSDAIVNFAKNIAKAIGAAIGTLAGAASHFLVNPNSTIKSGSSQSTILYHTTKLDTKTIATSTTKYMVDSANRVPNNTARFDTGMSPTPVLMKQGTY